MYRTRFPAREILIPASLGIPVSLLAYLISLSAVLDSGTRFIEVNKFNAISLLSYGVDASMAASLVFSSLPFVALFLFRMLGVLDAKTTRILSVGLVTFGCFDCIHDIILVSTQSNDFLLTFFAPLGISLGLGTLLWAGAKRYIFTAA